MLQVNNLVGFGAGSAGSAPAAVVDTYTTSTGSNLITYTGTLTLSGVFDAVALIVSGRTNGGTQLVTAMSIDGTGVASLITEDSNQRQTAGTGMVLTNTTDPSYSITFANTMTSVHISAVALSGVGSATPLDSLATPNDPASDNLTSEVGGFLLGGGCTSASTAPASTTGIDTVLQSTQGNGDTNRYHYHGYSLLSAGGTHAFEIDWQPNDPATVACTWR